MNNPEINAESCCDDDPPAMTILLIEDDEKFARVVQKVLGVRGYEVLHAPTALEGLQLAEDSRVNLVLLDIDLPDLDGKVVATMLRARPYMRDVPIIAVTAQDGSTARRLIRGFGCDGHIPKPVDTRQFPDQIASYLDR
jgi:two-component system cell cycle response regulator DivK